MALPVPKDHKQRSPKNNQIKQQTLPARMASVGTWKISEVTEAESNDASLKKKSTDHESIRDA